ncbi:MAG: hypothetical protein M3O87_00280 [Candidatus Dormibacteraeota bacterium]|nr:hypothetical protein [Candidatus Dormibacteraeota bacterium]
MSAGLLLQVLVAGLAAQGQLGHSHLYAYTIIRLMKTQAGGIAAALAAVILSSCSLGQALGAQSASPTPQPSQAESPVALPNYNARFGNNRVAAEAAVRVGRALYAQQQYWEVYVKSDPAALSSAFDPARPESFDAPAKEVQRIDLILATESGPSIRTYALGGVEHEKQVLVDVAKVLQAMFPAATTINLRVFYGEANLHATGTYQGGGLDYHAGPTR